MRADCWSLCSALARTRRGHEIHKAAGAVERKVAPEAVCTRLFTLLFSNGEFKMFW